MVCIAGCALAPGAAQYVRMLLRNHAVIRQGEPEMSVPITVVGAVLVACLLRMNLFRKATVMFRLLQSI